MFIRNINWEDFYRSTFEVCPASSAKNKLKDLNDGELLLLRDYLEDAFNKAHMDLELKYSAKFMVDQIICEKENIKK